MKTSKAILWRRSLLAGAALAACAALIPGGGIPTAPRTHAAEPALREATLEVSALKAEVARLKGLVPDQSHAMKDVGYHFANLWFAADRTNWPLAEFYWSETRSHLHWAVRIIPVRKDPQGREIHLEEILAPIEKSTLEAVHQAILQKDRSNFRGSYQRMLESCYSCHLAAGKPYLRLQIPSQPEAPIIRFDPGP